MQKCKKEQSIGKEELMASCNLGLNKIEYISANMMKTFETCPKLFFLQYIEKVRLPQNTAKEQEGQNIHTIINYYLKGFDVSSLLSSLSQNERILWDNFLKLEISLTKQLTSDSSTIQSEMSFKVRINSSISETNNIPFWLTGRMDAVEIRNDELTIYDWKSANLPKDVRNEPQTQIYMFAAEMIFCPKKIKFKYVNLKTLEIKEISWDEDYKQKSFERLSYTAKKITSLGGLKSMMSRKNECKECNRCLYQFIC